MGDVIALVASVMGPAIAAALILELAKTRRQGNRLRSRSSQGPAHPRSGRTELTFQLRISLTARRDRPLDR